MRLFKVVIIDDEPWTREVIRQLGKWDTLELEIVGEASDGEYGLELIRQMTPDIILTDVSMPHLNGINLIHTLRQEGNNALVIFVSGYDNYEFIHNAMKVGAIDYLLKPIKQEELNQQLKKCKSILMVDKAEREEHLKGSFLDVSWASKYYVLQDSLYDSLNSNNIEIMKEKLEDIFQLIQQNANEMLSKSNMICIYYSLINTLQRYIMSRDYEVKEVIKSSKATFVFSRESNIEEMFYFVFDLYCSVYIKMQELIRTRNRIDINRIKQYAKENYAEGITLEETAETFYVSKEYLSKTFKATVGRGFSEYVTSLRMQRAKELIVDYKVPIKEAGELVGYMDQAHFYKTFKKFYGKTPGEMKED